jgi:hypothetical protein
MADNVKPSNATVAFMSDIMGTEVDRFSAVGAYAARLETGGDFMKLGQSPPNKDPIPTRQSLGTEAHQYLRDG